MIEEDEIELYAPDLVSCLIGGGKTILIERSEMKELVNSGKAITGNQMNILANMGDDKEILDAQYNKFLKENARITNIL